MKEDDYNHGGRMLRDEVVVDEGGEDMRAGGRRKEEDTYPANQREERGRST